MHSLIEGLFKKRGIKNVTELSVEEKAIFDKWQKILSTEEITMENVQEFLEELKEKAIKEIAEPDNTDKKDAKTKAMITFCDALLGFITSPKAEKEALENHLKQLLNQ